MKTLTQQLSSLFMVLFVIFTGILTPLSAQFCSNIITVTVPITKTSYIYQAQTGIIGLNTIQSGADASYRAGEFIELQPGFIAETNSGFETRISNSVCNNVVNENTKDPFLEQPATCSNKKIPVVVIAYFPNIAGTILDPVITGTSMSIPLMKNHIMTANVQAKFMLEEGSKFHGYKNPSAIPYLGYEVMDYIYVMEAFPIGLIVPWNPSVHRPDYIQILNRINGKHYVENLGVKEFWLWGYHFGNIEPAESNMSSPTTGDISNSERTLDLPVYNKTFVMYNYNYTRTAAEAVHNHGHQLEAQLGYTNQVQDGNQNLFRNQFVGWGNGPGGAPLNRCGDTHHPVNTWIDYDYQNFTPRTSDIENWQPSGGPSQSLSASRWANIPYAWPYNNPPTQKTESQWYIYWMQNMPGAGNSIPYNTNYMTNWWEYTADWDHNNTVHLGLYRNSISPSIACIPTPVRMSNLLIPKGPLHQSIATDTTRIYPNPAFEELNIHVDNQSETLLSIKIIDNTGSEVYFSSNNNLRKIDTSRLNRGMHTIILTFAEKVNAYTLILK